MDEVPAQRTSLPHGMAQYDQIKAGAIDGVRKAERFIVFSIDENGTFSHWAGAIERGEPGKDEEREIVTTTTFFKRAAFEMMRLVHQSQAARDEGK